MNWPKRTLGEIAEINPKVRVTKGEVTPFVTMDNVTAGVRDVSAATERPYSGGSRFINGDVLLARITPCLENGKIAIYRSETDQIAAGSTEFLVFRGIPEVSVSLFVYYWLKVPHVHETAIAHMNGTSGRQRVDVNAFSQEPILLPPFSEQQAISSVLGALDDKVAANVQLTHQILDLQRAIWNQATGALGLIKLHEVSEPILGGTPKRSEESNWSGEVPWSSVADMTAAQGAFLMSTAEGISKEAASKRRYSPLPAGSVLLSARGTVGKVVSIGAPMSFNQSAYGFQAPKGTEAALRLAIEDCVRELQSKSYGSVFSSITKNTISECNVPDVFDDPSLPLHKQLDVLEQRAFAAQKENEVLAQTRDELLPLLMSGKITLAEAAEVVDEMDVKKRKDPGNV